MFLTYRFVANRNVNYQVTEILHKTNNLELTREFFMRAKLNGLVAAGLFTCALSGHAAGLVAPDNDLRNDPPVV